MHSVKDTGQSCSLSAKHFKKDVLLFKLTSQPGSFEKHTETYSGSNWSTGRKTYVIDRCGLPF